MGRRGEAQPKVASSSTYLAAQCSEYRLASAQLRDFISESRCTELSISKTRRIRYSDVLSVAVTGTGPRVAWRKIETGVSDRMKATPGTGLVTRFTQPYEGRRAAVTGSLRSSFEFAPRNSELGSTRRVVKMGKRLDLCGKFSDCGLRKSLSTALLAMIWQCKALAHRLQTCGL